MAPPKSLNLAGYNPLGTALCAPLQGNTHAICEGPRQVAHRFGPLIRVNENRMNLL